MSKNYQRCTYCVMDNVSDDTIVFDDSGQCNYCKEALREKDNIYFPDEQGQKKLNELIAFLKEKGKGKEFDCLMGISGGLDSAYLAYLGSTWGLRILAVHIDDGFDTEISKENIEKLISAGGGIKMLTIKPDPVQFNDLIKAFMRASLPDIAIPQDNVLFAFLYDVAKKYEIKYFLSGGNYAMEYILQRGNSHNAMDLVHIKDIHKRFGTQPMSKLKFLTTIKKAWNNRVRGIKSIRPLNYIDYNKDKAFAELKQFCGFEYYGGKHLENYFTMFAQHYWLPRKFNVDKRKSHLSSLIVSDQMTRETALNILEQPLCEDEQLKKCIAIVKEKLSLSDEEFDEIMNAPIHAHTDYKTEKLAYMLKRIFK